MGSQEREFAKAFLGAGLTFPIQTDEVTGRMKISHYEKDITEAIHIILMTRKGERVMHPEFGCRIHDYTFSSLDYTTIKLMEAAVREALIMWEPRITKVQVDIQKSDENGRLDIHVGYLVRNTNNPYNLVYPFYVNEGLK